jgi:hypothetical protein
VKNPWGFFTAHTPPTTATNTIVATLLWMGKKVKCARKVSRKKKIA